VFFTRIYDRKLAQASYLVGCQATGDAIVIDPNRDVASYLALARAERFRISYVTETHIHADFVSGARELAQRAKAQLLLSGEGGTDWQYEFAASSGARVLHDGDSFSVGRLRFDVLHTPGHTPEHLAFLLTDTEASPHPLIVFTGDFVFVGDVGRPDLLEKAAKIANTMEAGAHDLWRSIGRFRALPDYVQVWPGHGAGSACGKALGEVPSSTVGYEKLVNWGVSAPDEAAFVRGVLEGQPEPPAYFARMKRVNREGPAFLGDLPAPHHLADAEFAKHHSAGAFVVDLRRADAFARGHIPGSINVPVTRSFTTYAGSVVPFDVPVVLVALTDEGAGVAECTRDLALIGIDTIVGFVGPAALEHAPPLATLERVPPADAIARHARGVAVVDVRNTNERSAYHVPGTRHIPFPQIVERAAELPLDQPLLIQCETGARSAIAASVLRGLGLDASDAGGIVAWSKNGGPVETAAP
jgi:hydroxyacylglutathione hydrolase